LAAALPLVAAVSVAGHRAHVVGIAAVPIDHKRNEGVTPGLLDAGSYPTTAVPFTANLHIILEGQRIADAVVVPDEIDAPMRQLGVSNTA
jgi:hypothetical protein